MSNDAPFLVHVETLPLITTAPAPAGARHQLGDGATYVSGTAAGMLARPVEEIGSAELQGSLARICGAIGSAMREASPDAWSVEFSLGFKAGAKVPVLLSGEANAALKITLNWKKP